MSKQTVIIGISVAIVAVIGVITFNASSDEMQQPPKNQSQATSTSVNDGITRSIDGIHQYQPDEGRHIVAGTTTVPTPCHQLSTKTDVRESNPEQVVISFAAEKEGDEVCAQEVQNRRFKVTFSASKQANIVGGTFDGDRIDLNLRDVGPDEDLDDFNVYTKG